MKKFKFMPVAFYDMHTKDELKGHHLYHVRTPDGIEHYRSVGLGVFKLEGVEERGKFHEQTIAAPFSPVISEPAQNSLR